MIDIASRSEQSPGRVKVRLTREGWQFTFLLLFMVFAAILQNINLLILVSGGCAAMILLQWRLTKRILAGLELNRVLPSKIEARRQFEIALTLSNSRRWLGSWLVGIQENIEYTEQRLHDKSDVTQTRIGLLVDEILPMQERLATYSCSVAHRGTYAIAQPELTTLFPFSLMRGTRKAGVKQTFIAHPTQGQLTPGWKRKLQVPLIGEARGSSEFAGNDDEFYSLRSYRSGDPTRYIHWRSSAKRNSLVVRQMERLEPRSFHLVLDLFEDEELSDAAIEFAATVLMQTVAKDRETMFLSIVAPDTPSFSIQSPYQLRSVLDMLATIRPQTVDYLPELLRTRHASLKGDEHTLVATTREALDTTRSKPSTPSFLHQQASLTSASSEANASSLAATTSLYAFPTTIWVGSTIFREIFVRG